MLDAMYIRKQPEAVREKLARRGFDVDFQPFLNDDAERRRLIGETESLKAERNRVSASIPLLKKAGNDISAELARMRDVGDQIKELDGELLLVNTRMSDFLDRLPNLPADDVVPGGKENNEVIYTWGEKPEFDFEPKHHVELVTQLRMIDYERGAKLAGSGYWIYQGMGARLEWALLSFFIDRHLADGYEMMLLPHIVSYECGYTSGQFPKFEEDIFRVSDGSDTFRFLLPTAETALASLYRDEILPEAELPKKLFAYTPCYRREAGSYRADERGMIRGHQFNKIEMFQYVVPADTDRALDELTEKAADLVRSLGLHFRVSKLAAEDCSASMEKTLDVEVYIPSMGGYKEVSSASSAGAYQARRGNIRYRSSETGKPEFLHTLNASGLATSRLIPAIVEQFQEADGSVRIPTVLQPYLGGLEWIRP
ncbi:MAG TPA: serine--tRNA ligase [Clostridiaceae bacterium]|jgi:seryl-tRNA synthetase|nr:serine--tRNA ligase [Clostridiaceae bacterium]